MGLAVLRPFFYLEIKVNVLTAIQKQVERKAGETPVSPTPLDINAAVTAIQQILIRLHQHNISVFDTCAALAIADKETRERFLSLVLKDQS
ncbi:MAG: hypothetical protein E6Q97_04495 [Desulfurellales bacterium]|nr:MAG: hypothetical protein E6Q97_04495 [Desulfurellales bacterium]